MNKKNQLSWKDVNWSKMPGRHPAPHTLFSQWMIKKALSNRSLAAGVGCNQATVARIRAGSTPSPVIRRLMLALYPDCPLPTKGGQTVYERVLPVPVPKRKPVVCRLASRAARAAYFRGLSARAKKRKG